MLQPDLSQAWTDVEIAQRQRELVDRQLADMYFGKEPEHFAVVPEVLRWLSESRRIDRVLNLLDAGCGSAYYNEIIEHFAPGLVEYFGLDYSDAMLEVAREYYPNATLIKGDLRRLKLIDRSYDIAMSGAALMHIREWRDALSELARVAKFWLLLHRTWILTGDRHTEMSIGEAYGHAAWYITFGRADIVGLLQQKGFELVLERDSGEMTRPGCVVKTLLFERIDG